MRPIERRIDFAAIEDLRITLKMISGPGKVSDCVSRDIPSCTSDADRVIRHRARVGHAEDRKTLKNLPAFRAEHKSVRFAGLVPGESMLRDDPFSCW